MLRGCLVFKLLEDGSRALFPNGFSGLCGVDEELLLDTTDGVFEELAGEEFGVVCVWICDKGGEDEFGEVEIDEDLVGDVLIFGAEVCCELDSSAVDFFDECPAMDAPWFIFEDGLHFFVDAEEGGFDMAGEELEDVSIGDDGSGLIWIQEVSCVGPDFVVLVSPVVGFWEGCIVVAGEGSLKEGTDGALHVGFPSEVNDGGVFLGIEVVLMEIREVGGAFGCCVVEDELGEGTGDLNKPLFSFVIEGEGFAGGFVARIESKGLEDFEGDIDGEAGLEQCVQGHAIAERLVGQSNDVCLSFEVGDASSASRAVKVVGGDGCGVVSVECVVDLFEDPTFARKEVELGDFVSFSLGAEPKHES